MVNETKSLRELLKESFSLFAGNIVRLLGVALAGVCLFLTATIVTIILMSLTAAFSGVKTQEAGIAAAALGGIFVFLLFLVFITIHILSSIAMIKVVDTANRGQAIGVFEAYKQARLLSLSYFTAMILTVGKIFLWSLLLIIPGVIFGIFYSLYSFAVVVDGQRGNQALAYSAKIIKPQIWRCIGYYVLISAASVLLFFACEYVVHQIFGVPQKGQFLLLPALGSLVIFVFNGIMGFYFFTFSYLFYEDLKKGTSELKK